MDSSDRENIRGPLIVAVPVVALLAIVDGLQHVSTIRTESIVHVDLSVERERECTVRRIHRLHVLEGLPVYWALPVHRIERAAAGWMIDDDSILRTGRREVVARCGRRRAVMNRSFSLDLSCS